jgi:hypothetical protein
MSKGTPTENDLLLKVKSLEISNSELKQELNSVKKQIDQLLIASSKTPEGAIDNLRNEMNKVQSILGLNKIQSTVPPEYILSLAQRWRFTLFLLGLISPGLAIFGFVYKDPRSIWGSLLFWMMSAVCSAAAGLSNPRGVRNGGVAEKLFVFACGLSSMAVAPIPGLTVDVNVGDDMSNSTNIDISGTLPSWTGSSNKGRVMSMAGFILTGLGGPFFLILAKIYDRRLTDKVRRLRP